MESKAILHEETESLADFGFDIEHIVCAFRFDDRKCYIIRNVENQPGQNLCRNGSMFTEIGHFQLNGYCYTILLKLPEKEIDDSNDINRILTARDLQVATLVALGCPNKQIADKLRISEWTVATYLRRMFAKLNVDSRAEMTYRCASLICKQEVAGK